MYKNTEITFKQLIEHALSWFNYIISKWVILIILGLTGGVVGYLYSVTYKPNYFAVLTFALEDKTTDGSGVGAIASQFGINLGGGEGGAFSGDNIIELLKSRYLIEKTLLTKVKINNKEDLLVNRYITSAGLRGSWQDKPLLKNLEYKDDNRDKYSLQQDSILRLIYQDIITLNLNVKKVDKKLNIVSVRYVSKDEIFAKLFSENLVKNVAQFYIETKTNRSRKNVDLLQQRADSVRRELDLAMQGRATLTDQNIGLVRQQAAVPRIRQELRVQMLSTMYGELIKNLEFSKLTLMREEPLIQIIDRPILPLENDRLGKTMGVLIFGFLFGFLGLFFFIAKRVFLTLMKE